MSRRQFTLGAVLCGAALLFGIAPATAAPIAPVSLLPALDVYIDALVAGHNAALACSAQWPAMKANEAGWAQAKPILIATLWANDFPIDFVRTATQRLDAAPPAPKPDCKNIDPALAGQLGWPSSAGWVEVIESSLKGMDLTVITDPIPPATWTAIKDLVAKALPGEKRLLDCVAVMYPETLPQNVHDWDEMIIKIGGDLAGTGLPRDEISATLSGAETNQIWHRVAPDGEAELRDSCRNDKTVQQTLANFGFTGLASEIEKLLPAASSDSGSN